MARLGILLLPFALGACSREAPPPLDIAQNKQMIWDAIKLYHDAEDKGDLDTIQSLLAPEVSLVLNHEDVIRGHDVVIRALRDRIKAYDGQPRSTITGKESISIVGDMALVTYVANVGTQRGSITAVCRRTKDNRWLITHIHDTWSMPALRK